MRFETKPRSAVTFDPSNRVAFPQPATPRDRIPLTNRSTTLPNPWRQTTPRSAGYSRRGVCFGIAG